MAQFIVQIEDKFLVWSTESHAPISFLMNEDGLQEYLFQEHGQDGTIGFEERMTRVRNHGTSCRTPTTVRQLIANNKAGKDGQPLSLDEIRFYYRDAQTKAALERT